MLQKAPLNLYLLIGGTVVITIIVVLLSMVGFCKWRRRRAQAGPTIAIVPNSFSGNWYPTQTAPLQSRRRSRPTKPRFSDISPDGNNDATDSREEMPKDVFFTTNEEVLVYSVRRNGDSLYASVAHQLYNGPIGSPEHAQNARTLRRMAYLQLWSNYEMYRDQLLESVAFHSDRYAELPTESAKIIDYLNDLREQGFGPGTEVIQVLADIMGVDVIMYPEKDTAHFVKSRAETVFKTIQIGRRLLTDEYGKIYQHYDSVERVKPIRDTFSTDTDTERPVVEYLQFGRGAADRRAYPVADNETQEEPPLAYRPGTGHDDSFLESPRQTFFTNSEAVTVRKVPKDSNSLYAALTHQIYKNPIGSPEQQAVTSWLRKIVRDHLRLNHMQYLELMLESVDFHRDQRMGMLKEDAKIQDYEPWLHTGAVVIQAAADLLGVDVKVYPEGGTPYILKSRAEPVILSVRIAQRLEEGADGRIYHHYDSVLGASPIKTLQTPIFTEDEAKTDTSALTEKEAEADVSHMKLGVTKVIPEADKHSQYPSTASEEKLSRLDDGVERDGSVVLSHDETFFTDSDAVTVYRMRKGGDSLYAAIAHQIYKHPIGSPTHEKVTAWLRSSGKVQLLLNLENYRELVLESLALHGERYERLASQDVMIQQYLQDLEEPGFSPGAEAIQVAADFLGVDVMVYPEGGRSFVVSSRAPLVKMVIKIGKRFLAGEDGEVHQHFDSVAVVRSTKPIALQTIHEEDEAAGVKASVADASRVPVTETAYGVTFDEEEMNEHKGADNILFLEPDDTFFTKREVVRVLRMPKDGDSLFAALIHQLHCRPIGSEQHAQDTRMLRKSISIELFLNTGKYLELLRQSVEFHGERYDNFQTLNSKVEMYLQDIDRPGFPGGIEVIHAMTNFLEVDVMVYPEGGDSFLVQSAVGRPRRIVSIGQRFVLGVDGRTYHHYDSVVDMRPIENVVGVSEHVEQTSEL